MTHKPNIVYLIENTITNEWWSTHLMWTDRFLESKVYKTFAKAEAMMFKYELDQILGVEVTSVQIDIPPSQKSV